MISQRDFIIAICVILISFVGAVIFLPSKSTTSESTEVDCWLLAAQRRMNRNALLGCELYKDSCVITIDDLLKMQQTKRLYEENCPNEIK